MDWVGSRYGQSANHRVDGDACSSAWEWVNALQRNVRREYGGAQCGEIVRKTDTLWRDRDSNIGDCGVCAKE